MLKLHDYLESNYVEKNMSLQIEGYTPFKKAETTATHELVQAQLKILKWISWFKILGSYFAIKLGFAKAPKTIEQFREDIRAQSEAKKSLDLETVDKESGQDSAAV